MSLHDGATDMLQQQFDAISELQAEVAGGDRSNLADWIAQTKVALRLSFGQDHAHYVEFDDLGFRYTGGYVVTPDIAEKKARLHAAAANSDLERAAAILKAAIVESGFLGATGQSAVTTPSVDPTIFIGHGGTSDDWKGIRDFLRDQLGYEVEYFESQSNAGYTVTERVLEMLDKADMAFLVMSAEDEQAPTGADDLTPQLRARQNVIHEAGLFQGRLGWKRALLVVEHGVERFSNADGVTEIRYEPGRITQTFGDIAAAIKREFG